MGSSHSLMLARLAAGSADFIATYPEAAAWFARRLEHIFAEESNRAEEREREEREQSRRAGRSY